MTGVYEWIRDGVRRAVLLGFSDAVEQLGLPQQGDEVNPALAAVFQETRAPRLASPTVSAEKPGRKRLGRSLGDIAKEEKPA